MTNFGWPEEVFLSGIHCICTPDLLFGGLLTVSKYYYLLLVSVNTWLCREHSMFPHQPTNIFIGHFRLIQQLTYALSERLLIFMADLLFWQLSSSMLEWVQCNGAILNVHNTRTHIYKGTSFCCVSLLMAAAAERGKENYTNVDPYPPLFCVLLCIVV